MDTSKNKNQYFESIWNGLAIKPWQVKEEFISFLDFIYENNIKSILEIGTYKGGSASAFLRLGCKVTSIDIVKQSEIAELEKQHGYSFYLRDNFTATSEYDLLFIDGDHSYEACKKDYEDYRSLVKKDGFIAFHDIVNSSLHAKQGCEVWKFMKELDEEKIEFVTDGTWGGIGIIKKI